MTKYRVFCLFILSLFYNASKTSEIQSQTQAPTVELSEELITQRNTLIEDIRRICEEFFKSEYRKAADAFRRHEIALYQKIKGTPEEVERTFAEMYHTHADAKSEQIALHYKLETIEALLRETGLSQVEVYLISIDTMDTVFAQYRDAEVLDMIQKNIQMQDTSVEEQERQYALALLYRLEHEEYESEGERIILAIQARNMLERTYIRKKYKKNN